MKKKAFLFLLVLTGLIYLLLRFYRSTADLIHHTGLIELDTASVTSLSILPPNDPEGEFFLKREGRSWIASQGNRSVRAVHEAVEALLSRLVRIESHQVISVEKEDWDKYGVGPRQGLRVRVFQNGSLLEDFLVGYQDAAFTYVRIWEDREVFAVRGMLQTGIWNGFAPFRSKVLLELDPQKVREVMWEPQDRDTVVVLEQTKGAYLDGLRRVSGESFADDFDPVSMVGLLRGRLIFAGTEWESPVEVSYYVDTLSPNPFIFHSTQNPDNYFASDSGGIFAHLIRPLYFPVEGEKRDSSSQ